MSLMEQFIQLKTKNRSLSDKRNQLLKEMLYHTRRLDKDYEFNGVTKMMISPTIRPNTIGNALNDINNISEQIGRNSVKLIKLRKQLREQDTENDESFLEVLEPRAGIDETKSVGKVTDIVAYLKSKIDKLANDNSPDPYGKLNRVIRYSCENNEESLLALLQVAQPNDSIVTTSSAFDINNSIKALKAVNIDVIDQFESDRIVYHGTTIVPLLNRETELAARELLYTLKYNPFHKAQTVFIDVGTRVNASNYKIVQTQITDTIQLVHDVNPTAIIVVRG